MMGGNRRPGDSSFLWIVSSDVKYGKRGPRWRGGGKMGMEGLEAEARRPPEASWETLLQQ